MKKKLLVAGVIAASAAMAAQAGTLDDGNLSISGFGTLGVAKSNTDDAQFARYNQADGVGENARIGLDTNLGLQATYKINDWLSGTAQILTHKASSPTFTTDLTWAFLKARVNDEISVRVGRVVVPTFLISDYQNVGYANNMMRPPVELYSQNPIENSDGADINYQHAFGDFNFTAQAFAGVSRGKLFIASNNGPTSTYRAPDYGISLTGEYGPFLFRFAHARADLTINDAVSLNTLTTTLKAVGFSGLASDLDLNSKKIDFNSVGMTMDWNNIVLQSEYAQRRAKEAVYLADSNSWYAMAGYRIGKVLPYYSHASLKGAGSTVNVPSTLAKIPALNAAVVGLLGAPEQTTNTIGVRWDFAKSLALKVQVDRIKPKSRNGTLIYAPATGYTSDVTVVGAALDFVF